MRSRDRTRLIVVADSVSMTRQLLGSVFRDLLGLSVVELESSGALLSVVREVTPDLVVTQINQPSDLIIVREVRDHLAGKGVPIVAMTAWTRTLSCKEVVESGVTDCVEKPFDLDDLLQRVRRLLHIE
ncbi:MAG TPA: response regulator [Chloroflexota bacterium]